MNVRFERLSESHTVDVMDIFNYYAENEFSAFAEGRMPDKFFAMMLNSVINYPAYAVYENSLLAGFGFLHSYSPMGIFKKTASITYFLHPSFTRKGIGSTVLEKLIEDAAAAGIENIMAEIASENQVSINFHKKHNFVECGRFQSIAEKFDKKFDIIWMQRKIK
ncbi:MAG: N-acetyltransferase [Spirochaetes bacterium]|nr:N-acetyltransferase [Spirochaetota bacterium]